MLSVLTDDVFQECSHIFCGGDATFGALFCDQVGSEAGCHAVIDNEVQKVIFSFLWGEII